MSEYMLDIPFAFSLLPTLILYASCYDLMEYFWQQTVLGDWCYHEQSSSDSVSPAVCPQHRPLLVCGGSSHQTSAQSCSSEQQLGNPHSMRHDLEIAQAPEVGSRVLWSPSWLPMLVMSPSCFYLYVWPKDSDFPLRFGQFAWVTQRIEGSTLLA